MSIASVCSASDFARFSLNYPPFFIERCWEDNKVLADHLSEKFFGYHKRHGATGVMLMFYLSLDGWNKRKLEDFINANSLNN
jgi:hypothetical protein